MNIHHVYVYMNIHHVYGYVNIHHVYSSTENIVVIRDFPSAQYISRLRIYPDDPSTLFAPKYRTL